MSQATPIAEPKQTIQKLFEIAGIQKVAYIDDKFNTDAYKPDFMGTLIGMYNSQQNRDKIDFVNWEKPEPIFKKEIEVIWESEGDTGRNNYLRKLYDVQGQKDDFINLNGVIEMPVHMAEFIETFSPKEWEAKRDEFLQENTKDESRVLCLFDKELSLEAGRDGISLLSEVMNGEYVDKIYCAIFSQHVSIGEEFSQKKEWIADYTIPPEIASRFYPISKETMQDEPVWGFIEGIKNVLIVEEVEQLKEQSKEIIRKAQNNVLNELDNLSPETYNRVIQKSSLEEGVWEMNTMFRISNIFQDYALKETIVEPKEREIFNASISTIRNFEEVEIDNVPMRWSSETTSLRMKEVYENGDLINALHFPVANGDIFQLGNKEYILLAQPCNLSLRKDGKRANNFEMVTLVQIVAKQQDSNAEMLPNTNKWVRFANHYSLKLDVLDLAVFDSEGICAIRMDDDLEDSIIYPISLVKRHEKIKETFKKCAGRLVAIKDLLSKVHGNQLDFLLKPSITLNSNFTGLPLKPFNQNTNTFDFKIKRICRLKEPYASHILQQFMHYLSRNAFEHDITKTI